METKIDIAAILKDKPKNIKLYSPIFGDVYFLGVEDNIIKVTHRGKLVIFFGDGRYYNYPESEPLLFPSKEMCDWSKFAWKRGDVLINNAGYKIFFDKWENDDYTRFFGSVKVHCYDTEDYTLASREEAQEFIKSTEKAYSGKLNLETLEIEKKTKFEDGDIAFADYGNRQYIFIVSVETGLSEGYNSSIYLDLSSPTPSTAFRTSFFKKDLCELRLATEEEKKQLFSALEKEGKRWDSDKKAIVDVKPKWTPKPFDKVLVRDSKSSKWRANLFSHKNIDEPYYCVYASWNYCIPYEGNEHLLGTTENVKE